MTRAKSLAQVFVEHYKTEEDKRRNGKLWIDAVDLPIIEACSKRPCHINRLEVYGKVALVNRMYAAKLGRYTKIRDPEWRVAERLVKRSVDSVIGRLAVFPQFNEQALSPVVQAHRKLVAIIRSVTGKNYASFAAKYLSFHFPRLVPIFDSKSVIWSKKIVSKLVGKKAVTADSEYEKHCKRILILYGLLREKKLKILI